MKVIIAILILAAYILGIINGCRKIPIWLNAPIIGIIIFIAFRVIAKAEF